MTPFTSSEYSPNKTDALRTPSARILPHAFMYSKVKCPRRILIILNAHTRYAKHIDEKFEKRTIVVRIYCT